jgi:hypothetical protein
MQLPLRHSRAAGVHVFNLTIYGSPLREDDEVVTGSPTREDDKVVIGSPTRADDEVVTGSPLREDDGQVDCGSSVERIGLGD